jgi:hypothetical protein
MGGMCATPYQSNNCGGNNGCGCNHDCCC